MRPDWPTLSCCTVLWVCGGEMRRPRSGHAPLLLSPRKRGVDKAFAKQVTNVIGWSVGWCSSVLSFHRSSASYSSATQWVSALCASHRESGICFTIKPHSHIPLSNPLEVSRSYVFNNHFWVHLGLYSPHWSRMTATCCAAASLRSVTSLNTCLLIFRHIYCGFMKNLFVIIVLQIKK